MAILVESHWTGIGLAEYDAARRRVAWESAPPPGGLLHAMSLTADGVRAIDIWETQDAFERYVAERLLPAVQELGIPGAPQVTIWTLHTFFVAPPLRGDADLSD